MMIVIRFLSFFVIIVVKQYECHPFDFSFGTFLQPSVSYGELGSFERDGEMRHVGFLPAAPEDIGTKFIYKTNQSEQVLLDYKNPKSLQQVTENITIAMLIHGYHSSGSDHLIVKLRNSILNFTKTNATIIVDWENGANSLNYFQTVSNTQLVGRQMALLVDRLRKYRKIDPKDIHLIGFSLGAQLAGFAARWAKKKYKFKFGRISALDAAMYLFEDYEIHVRKGDALFVDAIHTNAGESVYNNEYGSVKPFANVDFYPNGGSRQPQCVNNTERMCNHIAALIYYETSIKYLKSCEYLSVACSSYKHYLKQDCNVKNISRMGFHATRYNGTGKHYLQTTAAYPHKTPKPSKELFYYPRKDTEDTKSISSIGSSQDGVIKEEPKATSAKPDTATPTMETVVDGSSTTETPKTTEISKTTMTEESHTESTTAIEGLTTTEAGEDMRSSSNSSSESESATESASIDTNKSEL